MLKTLAIGALLGAALGIPIGPAIIAQAQASPVVEDDPAFDCVSMGNRICGPGNPQGQPAACYDDGGVIVAPWPCHVIVNADGSSDVYTG